MFKVIFVILYKYMKLFEKNLNWFCIKFLMIRDSVKMFVILIGFVIKVEGVC